jgi:predicted transcriptional regulator
LHFDYHLDQPYPEEKEALEKLITYMEDEMKDLHWYDEKIIRIHMEGTSMNQIHRETDIGLTSIKNTIKNGKAKIYEGIKEDWEDYQNGDYDKI